MPVDSPVTSTIQELHPVDRPREKMTQYGPEKLLDAELLAILLRTGRKGESALKMAERILQKTKDKGLENICVDDLTYFAGLGTAKACQIVAAIELGKRTIGKKQTKLILSPETVWQELRDIRGKRKEHFVVFFLDVRNQEIKREIISVGTLSTSLVHPREVFEPAIRVNAAHILVAHNHPSGDPTPSPEDRQVTERLRKAGEILGIQVVDHVVVTGERWRSVG